jgi:hypothetical protein
VIDFETALKVLSEAKVRFIVVGAYAAVAHGSSQVTRDLDICYERTAENMQKLAAALAPYHPHLRGVGPHLPFVLDGHALAQGMNFTLVKVSLICWGNSQESGALMRS